MDGLTEAILRIVMSGGLLGGVVLCLAGSSSNSCVTESNNCSLAGGI